MWKQERRVKDRKHTKNKHMSGKPDFVCDLKNFEFTFQFCAIYFFNVFTFLIHAFYFSIRNRVVCHSENVCICFSILCVIILHVFLIFLFTLIIFRSMTAILLAGI